MAKIELTTGNILKADAEAIVNAVNCVGIMGRGIALQFKKAFPANFRAYALACDQGVVQPGRMFIHDTGSFTNPRYIINFPTKRHWKGKSRIEDIESGLISLAAELRERGIRSIAIPPLGSGLGGLDWNDVRPRIVAALREAPGLDVLIYEPSGAPEVVKSTEVPPMRHGSASLIVLIQQYLKGLMDPFVTLIEVQKLMYFMQLAGQPLKLKYEKGPYGPYTQTLRHVFNRIEGHFISGYQDGGDQPLKELSIVPGAHEDAQAFVDSRPDMQERFERVAKLVEGFETPYGLELLATVHWVVKEQGASSSEEALSQIHNWNERKRNFTQRQVAIAFDTLKAKGWLATP